jgi:hypothetical protein
MSDSVRQQILEAIAAGITANCHTVKTVVLAEGELEMVRYTAAQTPLIQVRSGSESPTYEKSGSGHALWGFSIRLTCYYLGDIPEEEAGEALAKEIKDELGRDPTYGGVVTDIDVRDMTPSGEFPLWRLDFSLYASYEARIDNA